MVVGEIISATVSVTLKYLVWEGTAGPCVPMITGQCGGDVFTTLCPPLPSPGCVPHTPTSAYLPGAAV